MTERKPPGVAVIGAGRLARAILPLLEGAGYPVLAVASRRLADAQRAARSVPGAKATADPVRAIEGARIVFLAVPDREIAPIASRLAREAPGPWAGRIVLHAAGRLGTAPLRALARKGASTGVVHPMQVLGGVPRMARSVLPGSFARIEGDRGALPWARRIARALGLRPLRLRARLSDRDRAAYHAAASLASNDLLALLSAAAELLEAAGAKRTTALRALVRLAQGALLQAEVAGIGRALTGPVIRGDLDTVAAQLARLRSADPQLAELHRELSLRLLRLGEIEGIVSEAAREMKTLLAGGRIRTRTV